MLQGERGNLLPDLDLDRGVIGPPLIRMLNSKALRYVPIPSFRLLLPVIPYRFLFCCPETRHLVHHQLPYS